MKSQSKSTGKNEVKAPHLRKAKALEGEQTPKQDRPKQRNVSLPKRKALLDKAKKHLTGAQELKPSSGRRAFRWVVLGAKHLSLYAITGAKSVIKWTAGQFQRAKKGLKK